jgi:hypothetical protein
MEGVIVVVMLVIAYFTGCHAREWVTKVSYFFHGV